MIFYNNSNALSIFNKHQKYTNFGDFEVLEAIFVSGEARILNEGFSTLTRSVRAALQHMRSGEWWSGVQRLKMEFHPLDRNLQ